MKKLIDRDIFVQSGKKGGSTTALRGKNYYRNIGLKGSKIRWSKITKTEDGLEKPKIA